MARGVAGVARRGAAAGPGKGVSVRSVRRWAAVAAVAVVLLASVVLALAFSASPASAFSNWQHDGAMGCESCHRQGTPTDASCTGCHAGFQAYPNDTCWTCHAPGQDTSTLSTPSSACSQECHLWNAAQKAYDNPVHSRHDPHLGSPPECLDCHSPSDVDRRPGGQPAPQRPGHRLRPRARLPLVTAEARRQGRLRSCHTGCAGVPPRTRPRAPASRTAAPATPRGTPARTVPQSKCAQCHKGTARADAAQHSSTVTKKLRLHRLSHQGAARVQGQQRRQELQHLPRQQVPRHAAHAVAHASAPGATARPLSHANGYQCTLCHRRAVHNPRPARTPERREVPPHHTRRHDRRQSLITGRGDSSGCRWRRRPRSRFCSTCKSHVPYVEWYDKSAHKRRQLRAVPHQAGPVLLPHLQARGAAAAHRADHRRLREAHPRVRAQPVLPPLPHQRRRCSRPSARSGIRVNHKHLIEAGFLCQRCHSTTAHGDAIPEGSRTYPVMEQCLICHNNDYKAADGTVATSRCDLCHAKRNYGAMPASHKEPTGPRATAPSACSPPAAPVTSRRTPAAKCHSGILDAAPGRVALRARQDGRGQGPPVVRPVPRHQGVLQDLPPGAHAAPEDFVAEPSQAAPQKSARPPASTVTCWTTARPATSSTRPATRAPTASSRASTTRRVRGVEGTMTATPAVSE